MIEGQFDIVGCSLPIEFFGNVTPQTLSHGYLFVGPDGSGKRTFALRLAQSLLCETPKAGVLGYCGTCGACTRIERNVHPDLYVLEGQLKMGSGESRGFHAEDMGARDLVRQLSMHSYAGGRRVLVLPDADITPQAANALLKFFEEPPPGVHVFGTTSSLDRVLATIRSRMVAVQFPRLSVGEVATILGGLGANPEEALRIARLANAHVGRALAILEGENPVRDNAIAWFYAVLENGEIDSTWWTRTTLEEGLDTVRSLLRDWIALELGGATVPLALPDQRERLKRLRAPDSALVARAFDALSGAARMARTNVAPELVANLVRMALVTIAA
jgi:DNA polymerase III, delta subunit